MPHDVFICHSSKDHIVANAARAKLEEANIRCWIAPRDPVPGIPYEEQIVEAIENTKLLLLIYSSASSDSSSVRRELAVAADCGKPIVPFRLESITPARAMRFYLTSPHWLDALTPPLEARLAELVASVPQIIQLTAGMDLTEPSNIGEVPQREDTSRVLRHESPSSEDDRSEGSADAPDVFISYAHPDNEPAFPGQEGWVEILRRVLDTRLRQLLGRDVLTFFDRSLPFAGGQEVFEVFEEAVASADAFVVVVSPSYLRSAWCVRELQRFLGSDSHRAGVYPVYKSAIERPLLGGIPALADRLGYQFYRLEDAREYPFDPNLGDNERREFLIMVDRLARDIASTLRDGTR